MKNDQNRKNGENVKIGKNCKNKWSRLGRYMNRMEPGKKVLNSWDRDLSIGDLEWAVRLQKNVTNGQYVFGF